MEEQKKEIKELKTQFTQMEEQKEKEIKELRTQFGGLQDVLNDVRSLLTHFMRPNSSGQTCGITLFNSGPIHFRFINSVCRMARSRQPPKS